MDSSDLASHLSELSFDAFTEEVHDVCEASLALLRRDPSPGPAEIHDAVCSMVRCRDELLAIAARSASPRPTEELLVSWTIVFAWSQFGRDLFGLIEEGMALVRAVGDQGEKSCVADALRLATAARRLRQEVKDLAAGLSAPEEDEPAVLRFRG